MGRLPFNPDRIAAKKKKSSNEPISVSQLAAQIGRAIGDGLPTKVHVVGEVSGFRERTHWYFDLKDRDAVVNCAVWASAAKRLSVRPENGRTFVATGRVEHYAKGGRLTLVITSLEPLGRGSLDAEYRALCDELRERGYFDPGRKRDLPTLPKRVAVITSRSGAALQDILRTAEQRCPGVPWLIVDSRVQGDGAAAELVGRVRTIASITKRWASMSSSLPVAAALSKTSGPSTTKSSPARSSNALSRLSPASGTRATRPSPSSWPTLDAPPRRKRPWCCCPMSRSCLSNSAGKRNGCSARSNAVSASRAQRWIVPPDIRSLPIPNRSSIEHAAIPITRLFCSHAASAARPATRVVNWTRSRRGSMRTAHARPTPRRLPASISLVLGSLRRCVTPSATRRAASREPTRRRPCNARSRAGAITSMPSPANCGPSGPPRSSPADTASRSSPTARCSGLRRVPPAGPS